MLVDQLRNNCSFPDVKNGGVSVWMGSKHVLVQMRKWLVILAKQPARPANVDPTKRFLLGKHILPVNLYEYIFLIKGFLSLFLYFGV